NPGRPGKSALKAAVESAVCIEPRDSRAVDAIDRSEVARHEYLVVSLHRDRKDGAVSPSLKAAVQRAVRIEPRNVVEVLPIDVGEFAPNEHFAIALYRD